MLGPLKLHLILISLLALSRHEIGGPLDLFDPVSKTWSSTDAILEESEIAGPSPRSVHGFVRLYGEPMWAGKEALALLFMGEGVGAPVELGHDGAGKVSLQMVNSDQDYSFNLISSSSQTCTYCCARHRVSTRSVKPFLGL